MTAISWTNETWNPVTGCSRVSDGCRYCYAERLSLERGWSRVPWTAANAAENVRLRPERLGQPFRWREPRRVFVNSMSDLFHEMVPDEFIHRVMDVVEQTPHTYQVLTKRSERLRRWERWPANLWMGVSVEDDRVRHRIDDLRACGAAVRFISAEPLIGPLDLRGRLDGIHWVIVGGESGPHMTDDNPRRMRMEWARAVRDACVAAGVAFFYKQDAGRRTELRPWLVEEDGSRWRWHQYPGQLTPPERVG